MTNGTTLVLGGTGKTGRRIVQELTGRNLPVRIGTRSGGLPFDWEDQDTWAPAMQGIDAVYVSYFPDLAVPGATEAIQAFTQTAVAAGVKRLVLLSGRGEEEAQAAEKIVQDSGLEWTIVRSAWFNQNFSENYLLEPVQGGNVVLPVGDIGEPFVDADDIADVAVAALTEEGHVGQVYEVTGPRLLTFGEAVAEIAKATGRDIAFVSVPAADYAEALRASGLPSETMDFLIYLFVTVLDGRNAHVSDGVERALGRKPKDFANYAGETAATGIWNP